VHLIYRGGERANKAVGEWRLVSGGESESPLKVTPKKKRPLDLGLLNKLSLLKIGGEAGFGGTYFLLGEGYLCCVRYI